MARSARPTNSHTIGTHGLDVMEIALIVIWGTPLFLAMCTGWSSAWSYFRHTIPYVFLMPMYIGLLTAFALARLDDFSWYVRCACWGRKQRIGTRRPHIPKLASSYFKFVVMV
jgi:hypothetical protein